MAKTKSKTSPKGGKRGCLCPDGTYSSECCNGDLQAQGIGNTYATGNETVSETESNGTRVRVRVSG